MNISDYVNAIRVASCRSLLRVPLATVSVLHARFGYKIGPRFHSLFNLAARPRSDWAHFILDTESNPQIRAANGEQNLHLARDKLAFTAHCHENDLPTIPILCVIDRKPTVDLSGVPAPSTGEEMDAVLATAPDELFFKLIDGAHGDGAFVASWRNGSWNFDGEVGSASDLYRYCVQRLGEQRGWLVQPVVTPHPDLRPIMPLGALGTVRAVTYLSEAGPLILLPVLRIPAGGNLADNFSEGAAGNIVAPIEVNSGVLGTGQMSRSKSWPDMVTVDSHPDTGHRIVGFRLPDWRETVDLMLTAQRLTPRLRTIGWDIALTSTGPIIVEANTGYCPMVLQVAYGRGIRKDLAPILAMQSFP